jgi:hypothetical protein
MPFNQLHWRRQFGGWSPAQPGRPRYKNARVSLHKLELENIKGKWAELHASDFNWKQLT